MATSSISVTGRIFASIFEIAVSLSCIPLTANLAISSNCLILGLLSSRACLTLSPIRFFGFLCDLIKVHSLPYFKIQLDYTIDDDIYIDDWWEDLSKMRTYFGDLNTPNVSLDRHGVTLIPPESLSIFETIVSNDPRIKQDYSLMELLKLIRKAKQENKYMIHFGV